MTNNCEYMFWNCRQLTSIPWNEFNIDTSQCTSMYAMFYDCRYITSLNLTGMDTSKVTDMEYMFYCCESLHEIICPDGFDLSSCTSVDSMFLGINTYSYTGEPLHFKNVPRDLGFGSIDITEGICYVIDSYKD